MLSHKRMFKLHPFLLLCLLLLPTAFLQAQTFTETNHANWYRPSAAVRSALLVQQESPDSLQVFASLQLPDNRNPQSYQLFIHLRNQLDTLTESMPGPFELEEPEMEAGQYLYKRSIPWHDSLSYLLLEVRDSLNPAQPYWAMANLAAEYSYPPAPFHLLQIPDSLPLFKEYRQKEKPLLIQGVDTSYTLFFYKEDFDAASPPMSASAGNAPALEVTNTRLLSPNSLLSFSEEGLYFIQHDTSQLSGRSFRITNTFFPEVATLEDLSGPIRYISTEEEWNRLKGTNFSKTEIDRFWLKVAQTEERARSIIRNYYERVALANRFFTNYKEGWKTDQGMIYILYGNPDVVRALPEKEEWIYRQTADIPEIKFTFVRVKNPFTDRHLVLLRKKNYTKTHYQIVSQWRKGRRTM